MIELTDYQELYFANFGRSFTLPKRGDFAVFECFAYDEYTSDRFVKNLAWLLHRETPVERFFVLANPVPKLGDLTHFDDHDVLNSCFVGIVSILRLHALAELFRLNTAYGVWTILAQSGERNLTLEKLLSIDSLDHFQFGFEIDIDAGMRGCGDLQKSSCSLANRFEFRLRWKKTGRLGLSGCHSPSRKSEDNALRLDS